jgi:hypothetical protein
LDPRLDLFAWIRAHDMLDLRFLPYGTCQYHHMRGQRLTMQRWTCNDTGTYVPSQTQNQQNGCAESFILIRDFAKTYIRTSRCTFVRQDVHSYSVADVVARRV